MIRKVDHLVITSSDIAKTLNFYENIGFEVKSANGRYELFAGDFKINVHLLGKELLPHAEYVQPGSGDFCFEIEGSLASFQERLLQKRIKTVLGIVERNGVRGAMKSIYLRDPDGNLVEFCSYE